MGIYSSSGALQEEIYNHPEFQGVLVRGSWAQIEPSPGVFDFSVIDRQVESVESHGKRWSLAISAGGIGSPGWLMDDLGAESLSYTFRGERDYRLPLIWDATVQERLGILAEALGKRYGRNEALALVYIPQMTSNGIEGHFHGVNMRAFRQAGFTADRWIDGSLAVAGAFASAFPSKPLAFEVHEVDRGVEIPKEIINRLWTDPSFGGRVGVAIWWVSGKENYQPALLEVLRKFPGDKYGQVIGRSDQKVRFADEDYALVFSQAKSLGLRYLEPWEYELKAGRFAANGKWDPLFSDFNDWARSNFPVCGSESVESGD